MCSSGDSNISVGDSDVIYFDPNKVENAEDCWKCWDFPKTTLRKDIIIQNPKYCWLYPRLQRKKLREVVPSFEDIKTLYTSCDFKLEACVHEKLLELEEGLKAYEKQIEEEVKFQCEIIDDLWELSYTLTLLTNSSPVIKFYPELVSAPKERRLLCDFFAIVPKLHQSNCRLSVALGVVRNAMKEVDERIAKLDKTIESPFVQGKGVFHLPLDQICELANDVFKYYHGTLCKLKCWAQLVDPMDTPAILDYQSLVESIRDNYHGSIGGENCTCRRSHKSDCIKRKKPC